MPLSVPENVIQDFMTFLDNRLAGSSSARPQKGLVRKAVNVALGLLDVADNSAIDLDNVKEAIALFQRLSGITGNPGVLTVGLAERILNEIRVADATSGRSTRRKIRQPIAESEDTSAFWIRYFVDTDSFEQFSGPDRVRTLLDEAWQLWLDHTAFLLVREMEQDELPDDDRGIVYVRAGNVDSGVGLANKLGPGLFNSDGIAVTLDIKEINMGDEQFRAIAAHEFGHIMGIGHLGRSGNLMSTVVVNSITKPMSSDIAAAQRIYGAKPEREPIPDPGDFPVPGPV